MDDVHDEQEQGGSNGRQPILLLPRLVIVLASLMVLIHALRVLALNELAALEFIVWFGFLPLRLIDAPAIPGGLLPLLWTPVTHAFLHGSWEHLLFNVAWLTIFGTPVARRYGSGKTLLLFLASAVLGAAAFTVTELGAVAFLIGASGGVAGLTGAAVRFVFQPVITARHPETGEIVVLGRRLASLGELWRNAPSRFFILVWIVLNAAVPLLPALTGSGDIEIAWQAHLGGFFCGLVLAPLFERRRGVTGWTTRI